MSQLSLRITSQWGLSHKPEKQKVFLLLLTPYKMVGCNSDYLSKKVCSSYVESTVFLSKIYLQQFGRSFIVDETIFFHSNYVLTGLSFCQRFQFSGRMFCSLKPPRRSFFVLRQFQKTVVVVVKKS